jgi:thiamine monophosphate kinase
MNRIRLYWHRIFRRPVVTGPYRLYVRRTPAGAMLDVSDYLIAMIETIADNDDLMSLLIEIEEDRRNARKHRHDGWEPEQLLVEQLIAALGYELPLNGPAVGRLADRLRAVAPVVSIPAQREAGAA